MAEIKNYAGIITIDGLGITMDATTFISIGSTGSPTINIGVDGSIIMIAGATYTPGGQIGATGPTGADGTNGTNGIDGATGPTGADGTNGTNGTDGATGPTGPTGADGTNGTNGTDGATGPTGADGTNGTNGTDGATGSTGPTGADGTNGTNGIDGATGPTGPTGADGANGDPVDVILTVENAGLLDFDSTKGLTFTHSGDAIGKNFTIQEIGLGNLFLQSTGLTAKVNIVSNSTSAYAVSIEALSGGIHFNPGTTEGTLFDNKIKIGGDLIYNSTTTTSATGGDNPDIILTNKALTLLTLDSGVGNAIYMSNGFNGQVKTIVVNSVQGGATAVITKGTGAGQTNIINQNINTITFSNVGSSATFIYIAGAGWSLINSYDVTIA
jgi:hypothetical protein